MMRQLFCILCGLVLILLAQPVLAAPILSVRPITWDTVGLDSNNPNNGPNLFPVGARVCNTGDTAATNVTATFVRTGIPNLFVTLQGTGSLVTETIPAGPAPASPYTINNTPANCSDFYFNVVLTRTALAYNTTQPYRIDITANNAAGVSTPSNRQLFIESLISQARNSVQTFTGPSNVQIGGIYQYFLTASTATGGYEQIANFPLFPTTIFRILSVSTTYSTPVGAINSTVYGDACGWDPNIGLTPPLGTYLSCKGPINYTDGKVGNTLNSVYTVQILSTGNDTVASVIYDFSGSSYHYNNDYGTLLNQVSVTATNPPPPTAVKTQQLVSDPVNGSTNPKSIPGARLNYSVTVSSSADVPLGNNGTVVLDPIPAGASLVVADFGAPGSGPVGFTNGTPSSGLTYTFTSLASTTDDVSFSNNNGATFAYVPVADANGSDSAVTHIRINPKGAMNPASGGISSSFTVRFGVRVK